MEYCIIKYIHGGLYKMKITIRKWGNSLAIRVPNDYVKTYNLSDGLEVDILAKEAGIMIQTEMSLEEMLVTVDEGYIPPRPWEDIMPVGRELW